MTLAEYQKQAAKTDLNRDGQGLKAHVTPLGLVGEVGSLASAFKKHIRDGKAFVGFRAQFIEDLCDTLWYLATFANHYGVKLEVTIRKKQKKRILMADLDRLFNIVAELVHHHTIDEAHLQKTEQKNLLDEAVEIVQRMSHAVDSSLGDIISASVAKVKNRWGPNDERKRKAKARSFDRKFPRQERLPRKMVISISETVTRSGTIARMSYLGRYLGDPLTDNAGFPDGYRFHDVFHLANLAVVGWSPVSRALLKAKRKSNARVDEVEDGARAQIAEEAIVMLSFNYLQRHPQHSIDRLDHDFLKVIKELTQFLEVRDIAEWEWEKAILNGIDVFRSIKSAGNGKLIVDMDKRVLKFRPA